MKHFRMTLLGLFFMLSLAIIGTTTSGAYVSTPSKPQSEQPFRVIDITTDEVKSLVDNAISQKIPAVEVPLFLIFKDYVAKTIFSPYVASNGVTFGVDLEVLMANPEKYRDGINEFNDWRPTLGEPVRIHWLDIGKARADNTADLLSIIYPSNEWWVPVIVSGEAKGILNVAYFEGQWQVSGGAIGDYSGIINPNMRDEFKPGHGNNKFIDMPLVASFTVVDLGGNYRILVDRYHEKMKHLDESKKDPDGLYDQDYIFRTILGRPDKGPFHKTLDDVEHILLDTKTDADGGTEASGKPQRILGGWMKTYGGAGQDYAFGIQQTSAGGYIVAGSANGRNDMVGGWSRPTGTKGPEAWMFKLDGSGNVLWQETFTGPEAYAVQQTSDGGFIVGGSSVFKTDNNGKVLWQRTYEGATVYAVQQTSDGGFIIAGFIHSTSAVMPQAWISKIDNSGNVLWQKTYDGAAASAVQQTSDGGFVLAGGPTYSSYRGSPAWVSKIDNSGNVLWQKTYSDEYNFNAIQQTSDGGLIIAGGTHSRATLVREAFVSKIDTSGHVLWQKTYGSYYATAIQQTSDNRFIVAGHSGSERSKAWVFEIDREGTVLWQKTYGDASYASAIKQTSDGGFIVAGSIFSGKERLYDALVFKIDSKGNM